MQIEVDIFSGRSNPAWEATPKEAEDINAVLAGLPDAEGEVPPPSHQLGFRGFWLTDQQSSRRVYVHGTAVQIQTATSVAAKLDSARQLQQIIVGISRSHLGVDLYAFLESQLDR
jgi:hypothetical protein